MNSLFRNLNGHVLSPRDQDRVTLIFLPPIRETTPALLKTGPKPRFDAFFRPPIMTRLIECLDQDCSDRHFRRRLRPDKSLSYRPE